jgi:hypothetical protein
MSPSLRRWFCVLSASVRGRISELMLSKGARIARPRSPSPAGFDRPVPLRHKRRTEGCTLPREGRGISSLSSIMDVPAFWSPLVARAMVSRGYIRDVSRVLSSRRSDDTNRRTFQSRCYGRMHSGTERRVHLAVTWFSVCCAFDFGHATELVIVTHHTMIVRPQAKRRQSIPVVKCVILTERGA